MPDKSVRITSGLPVAKNPGQSATAKSVFITSGLPPEVTTAAGGDPEGYLIGGKLIRGGLLTRSRLAG